eukprot:5223929-Amphidinium_carterae.3
MSAMLKLHVSARSSQSLGSSEYGIAARPRCSGEASHTTAEVPTSLRSSLLCWAEANLIEGAQLSRTAALRVSCCQAASRKWHNEPVGRPLGLVRKIRTRRSYENGWSNQIHESCDGCWSLGNPTDKDEARHQATNIAAEVSIWPQGRCSKTCRLSSPPRNTQSNQGFKARPSSQTALARLVTSTRAQLELLKVENKSHLAVACHGE